MVCLLSNVSKIAIRQVAILQNNTVKVDAFKKVEFSSNHLFEHKYNNRDLIIFGGGKSRQG
jgi:hypothetical protein